MADAQDQRERYQKIKAVFTAVCGLTGAELDEALASRCGGDADLRASVEALLDAHGQASVFGPALADAIASSLDAGHAPPGAMPERIGRFLVEGLIAEGGMSSVYRARQTHPDRVVAIKLIRPGPGTWSLLPRLDREARLLGRLQHPGIAQVIEAGRYESAFGPMPFLAMEFVDGLPIDEYASGAGLGVAERLALVAEVCHAVEHAHQRGVIHRDIKPANILVTREGRVKVLDFGVARLLEAETEGATAHTTAGQLLGTVQYMSPEQASGALDEIDTRSDVYALGVLAYELLAGRPPHDLRGVSIGAAARVVQSEHPPRLGQVDPRLRGDVEIVVAKAMEKEKERRYPSASVLGADLQRVLENRPILARPPTTVYQLRKFTRRNKGLVAGLGVAALALVLGAAFASWQAVERSREAARLRAVNEFWNDLFRSPDPRQSSLGEEGAVDVTVVAYLEEASERLGEAYSEQPSVEAELRATIGATYLVMDAFDRALPELERAWALKADLLGARDLQTLVARVQVAQALVGLRRHDEAEAMLQETLELIDEVAGPNAEEAVSCINELSALAAYSGNMEGVTRWTEEAVSRARAGGLERTATGADALGNLAWATMRKSDYERARGLYGEALASWDEVEDESAGLGRLSVVQNLAELEWRSGRSERAAELLDEVVRVHVERFGPTNGRTLNVMANRAQVRFSGGEWEEAIAELERVREAYLAVGREEGALTTDYTIGRLLLNSGEYERGARLNREVFERYERLQGPDAIATMVALNHWAVCMRNQEKLEEAAPLYASLLERMGRAFGEAPDGREAALRGSAANYFRQAGRYEDAAEQWLRVYEIYVALSLEDGRRSTAGSLAELYEEWGRPDEAAEWREVAEGD